MANRRNGPRAEELSADVVSEWFENLEGEAMMAATGKLLGNLTDSEIAGLIDEMLLPSLTAEVRAEVLNAAVSKVHPSAAGPVVLGMLQELPAQTVDSLIRAYFKQAEPQKAVAPHHPNRPHATAHAHPTHTLPTTHAGSCIVTSDARNRFRCRCCSRSTRR
jgi:hypothetical protein